MPAIGPHHTLEAGAVPLTAACSEGDACTPVDNAPAVLTCAVTGAARLTAPLTRAAAGIRLGAVALTTLPTDGPVREGRGDEAGGSSGSSSRDTRVMSSLFLGQRLCVMATIRHYSKEHHTRDMSVVK
jgi:hypothetical protein